jgi:broad-specificity NMP kinase
MRRTESSCTGQPDLIRNQVVVKDVTGVLKAIETQRTGSVRVIAVDGFPGSGKSTLGAQVAAALDAQVVDFDDFLIRDQGEFISALKLTDLATAMDADQGLVVASGVCMLLVLLRLQIKPDLLVYVKRMAIWGWADQDEVEGDEAEGATIITGSNLDHHPLDLEVHRYHRQFRPQDVADVVLERLEDD